MVSAYLLGLMILMAGVWDIKPFGYVPPDGYLVVTLAYLLFSFILFPGRKFKFFSKQMLPFWLIVLGMALSMLPAKMFYGQSVLQSVITYRSQSLWFAIPVVCRLKPKESDIFRASLLCTILMFMVTVMHAIMPALFVETQEAGAFTFNDYLVNSVTLGVLPLIISMNRLNKSFDVSSFATVIFCLIFFFVAQNRTAIFAVAMVTGGMLLSSSFKYKYVILVVMLMLAAFFVYRTFEIWQALLNETISQIGDDDYNRNKALLYFFSPLANPSWLTYILGNGFLSVHATSLMADMMLEGVYNSDMGFVGFWNQFGILPIIAFFTLIIKGIFVNKSSIIPLGCSIFILLTSMTIGYYANISALTCFVFMYYFIEAEKKKKVILLTRTDGLCGE